MLKCILFDLDGLLVDSEPLQFRSYQYALKQFGITLDMEDWIQWHSVEASTTRWIKGRNLDLDPEVVRSVKKDHYDNLIANELVLKPGARKLVKECAGEFELAVVSSSRQESIEGCMRKFNLHEYFDKFVSGADLPRSKPFPDSYQEALKTMNLKSQDAVALEDSETGFKAAMAAGVECIVCPDHFTSKSNDAFHGAAYIVKSLLELNPESLRAIHATKGNKNPSET